MFTKILLFVVFLFVFLPAADFIFLHPEDLKGTFRKWWIDWWHK